MIKLHTENLHRIPEPHGLSNEELSGAASQLKPFLSNLTSLNLGFHLLPENKETVDSILDYRNSVKDKYDHFVVLGIGGSALGTTCIRQSLGHLFEPSRLIVLDNIDPALLHEALEILNLKRTLFIVVTKSGSTPETLAQFFYFRDIYDKNKLPWRDHFVIVTDPTKGFLRKIAEKETLTSFPVPENVGGRFSVLSPVGLLPASLLGFDIEKMLVGALEMKKLFFSENPDENIPFRLASIQYLLNEKGKNINVLMPYAQKLISFAAWYKQLLAESIGKKFNRNGEIAFTGITPVSALGATDQHSQTQLYNEGPNDKLHIFIEIEKSTPELKIPIPAIADETLDYLKGTTFNNLLRTEMAGTIEALTENGRPNIKFSIDRIDEKTLGAMFMLFEGATAFLGEFFNINAFDQPGVELSKQITKKLLFSQQ